MNIDLQDYRLNQHGHLVPVESIKPLDKKRDELVLGVIERAQNAQVYLTEFKRDVFKMVNDYFDWACATYETNIRGKKGNVTLFSFDCKMKVVVSVSEQISFDERLQIAKSKIDRCIENWSKDSDGKIVTLINHAFSVDKQGKVNVDRILGLLKLEMNDAEWDIAMEAIKDSIQVTGSKEYMRFYTRENQTDGWTAISLDVSAIKLT